MDASLLLTNIAREAFETGQKAHVEGVTHAANGRHEEALTSYAIALAFSDFASRLNKLVD